MNIRGKIEVAYILEKDNIRTTRHSPRCLDVVIRFVLNYSVITDIRICYGASGSHNICEIF